MPSKINNSQVLTWGFGRFLVDLPDHFVLLANSSIEFVFGTTSNFYKIEMRAVRTAGASPSFESIVNTRASELRASHHHEADSKSRLIVSRQVGQESGSPVVIRSFTSARLMRAFTCEVFVERGDTVTVLSRKLFESGEPVSPEAAEAQLIDLANRLRHVDPGSATERGVCLGKALLDSSYDGEYASASFRSTLWPECRFSLTSRSLLTELDGGLLKRVDEQSALLTKMGFRSKVLRKGATTLGGVPAEELLETGQDQGKTVRSFMAEVVLKTSATFAKPLLTLDCKMGGQVEHEYVEPQLAEADALALWDAVRSSVRPRHGAI